MCWLALLPLPPPWLCPAALRPPQLWKLQPSSHRGPGLGLELLKKPHTTVAIWPVWTLPGKAPSEEFIFIRPDWELTEKTPIHTAYVKKMKSNKHLTSMLPEAMILFEANKSLAKKKKNYRSGEWDVHRRHCTALTSCWGSGRPHICTELCTCPGMTGDAPVFYLWLNRAFAQSVKNG